MIDLQTQGNAVLLPVHAQPRAKKDAVVGTHAGRLKVSVTAPPDKGKANQAILTVLTEELELRPGQVELIRGATSRQKVVRIQDVSLDELTSRLERCLSRVNRQT